MSTPGVIDRPAPCGFTCILHRRKILFITQLHSGAASALENRSIPCGNVQNQFPDAVRVLYGVNSGRRGVDALQNFADRIAVPRFSVESAAYLVS
jgi:hypothetical protein